MSRRARAEPVDGEGGQVLVLLVGALVAVLAGVFVLGAVARGVGRQGEAQRAADLAALAGARAMHAAYPRLFEPACSTAQRTRGIWRRPSTSRSRGRRPSGWRPRTRAAS